MGKKNLPLKRWFPTTPRPTAVVGGPPPPAGGGDDKVSEASGTSASSLSSEPEQSTPPNSSSSGAWGNLDLSVSTTSSEDGTEVPGGTGTIMESSPPIGEGNGATTVVVPGGSGSASSTGGLEPSTTGAGPSGVASGMENVGPFAGPQVLFVSLPTIKSEFLDLDIMDMEFDKGSEAECSIVPPSTGNMAPSPTKGGTNLAGVAIPASRKRPSTGSKRQAKTKTTAKKKSRKSPRPVGKLPANLAKVVKDDVKCFYNTRAAAAAGIPPEEATGSGSVTRKRKRENGKGGNPKPMKKRKKCKSKLPVTSTTGEAVAPGPAKVPGQKKKKKKKKSKINKLHKKFEKLAVHPRGPRGDPPPRTLLRHCKMVADWDEYLTNLEEVRWVCPVDYFVHAPFSTTWQTFARRGLKIEVRHPQMVGRRPVYCIATIVEFAGYKALMQFEKMGQGPDQYAWLSYCGPAPKPLSYSVNNGILILPVQGLEMLVNPATDLEKSGKKLCEKYFGTNGTTRPIPDTISVDHVNQVHAELKRHNKGTFGLGKIVEIIAREDPSRKRLGIVVSVIGDRIVVQYMPNPDREQQEPGHIEAPRVEVSMKSDLVQRLGWSNTIGLSLRNVPKDIMAFPFLSNRNFPSFPLDLKIKHNMVFELRHPRRPYQIVSGFVYQRLHLGYFIARVDTNVKGEGTKYTFHVTSDYLLPCGFCAKHNIPLEVPCGENPDTFSWEAFCSKRKTTPLALDKLPKKPGHKFVKECKMEAAADVLQPNYFGPATVTCVAEHLLLIHFDGWPRQKPQYAQWVSAFSPDIYPAGWAELVGHDFQSHAVPHAPENTYYIAKEKKKKKKKKKNKSVK